MKSLADLEVRTLPRSDGALVGGSSLKPEFVDIIRCVPLYSNHGIDSLLPLAQTSDAY